MLAGELHILCLVFQHSILSSSELEIATAPVVQHVTRYQQLSSLTNKSDIIDKVQCFVGARAYQSLVEQGRTVQSSLA